MSDLKTINCTSCGAGLSVLGGGRVRSHTCGYCGAVMDAQENYQVLRKYKDMPRPRTPFEIGMSGTIKGVEFTIIGILGQESRDAWGVYPWVDHQLYSPTHGYCWLTWNGGHCVFTRQVRTVPNPTDATGYVRKTGITAMGEVFKVFEGYDAKVTFCEGEFTWAPEMGDTTKVTETVAPPLIFSYARGNGKGTPAEIEYELGEYLDRDETLEAFGASSYDEPSDVHPAQPFKANNLWQAMSFAGRICAAAALIMMIVMLMGGETLLKTRAPAEAGPHRIDFNVTDASRLHEIEVRSPVSNSWAYYDMTLMHGKDEVELASFGREISYYYGGSGEDSWSEGSQYSSVRFHPPEAGIYTFEITQTEGRSERFLPIEVVVTSGVVPIYWMVIVLVVMGLLGASIPILRWMFEARRWAEEGDDDDD